jgi:hypothetical protein
MRLWNVEYRGNLRLNTPMCLRRLDVCPWYPYFNFAASEGNVEVLFVSAKLSTKSRKRLSLESILTDKM